MSRNRDLANIISGGFTTADLPTLTANEIPNLDASKITTGSIADARIPASAVSQHATSFDDNKIVNDISTLALRQASNENKSAYNTNSMFVDVFQDDTGIGTETNTDRNSSEYVSSASLATGNKKTLTRAKIYTNATAYAIWQFRGSNDASSWTNLGNTMNVSQNADAYADSGYFSNTTAYRYYEFYKTNSAQGGQYHREIKLYEGGSGSTEISYTNLNTSSGRLTSNDVSLGNLDNLFDNSTSTPAFYTDSSGVGAYVRMDFNGIGDVENIVEATGNFISNAITASSSTNKMGAIITYQDNAGTNALNTDLVLQLSADNGSNFTTATMTALPDFATGIKMAKVNDLSVTAGTQLKYKISFANQSSGSKEARIRGVSLQY